MTNVINRSACRLDKLHRPPGDDRGEGKTHIHEVSRESRSARTQRSEARAKRCSVYYKLKQTAHVAPRCTVAECSVSVITAYSSVVIIYSVVSLCSCGRATPTCCDAFWHITMGVLCSPRRIRSSDRGKGTIFTRHSGFLLRDRYCNLTLHQRTRVLA